MSNTLKLKINPEKIGRALFLGYMIYSNVTSYTLFFIRGLSSVFLFGALAMQLFSDRFKIKKDKSFMALLSFGLYILVSGIIVAKNYDRVISTAMTYFECLIVFYLVICYISKDKKTDFPMIVFILQSLVAAYFTINNGAGMKRISISEDVNVNTIGVMLALAIGFIMYLLISDKNKPLKIALSVGSILVLLFGIMLTSSKKAIIASAIFIVLWILFCYRFTFSKLSHITRILIFGALLFVSYYIFNWYTNNYAIQYQIVQNRMSQLYFGSSDQVRLDLIKEGFSIFFSHPLFGVGFNNARFYTSRNTYTHCFYSELVACTGLIGTLIFGYAIINPWYMLGNIRRNLKKGMNLINIQSIYILVIIIVLLVLCLAQILFYTPNLMYVFAIVTGYASLLCHKEELNEVVI